MNKERVGSRKSVVDSGSTRLIWGVNCCNRYDVREFAIAFAILCSELEAVNKASNDSVNSKSQSVLQTLTSWYVTLDLCEILSVFSYSYPEFM